VIDLLIALVFSALVTIGRLRDLIDAYASQFTEAAR
jgi:hypothetical protein